MKIGPVIQKDEIGFFRRDGKLAAKVTSAGGWLDLAARKLVAAPADFPSVR